MINDRSAVTVITPPSTPQASPMRRRLATLFVDIAGSTSLLMWGWGMHPAWWMWGAGGLVMMLMMLVFCGLMITGLVLGVRWLTRQPGHERADGALTILRERYARGEINKDEFEARRRDLGGRAA